MQSVCTTGGSNQLTTGRGVFISPGCEIRDDGPVILGEDVILGSHVRIRAEPERGVCIAARAWLGEGVRVEPGARIGAGALICSGTVVTGEVPANAVLEGNPAQIVWYLK